MLRGDIPYLLVLHKELRALFSANKRWHRGTKAWPVTKIPIRILEHHRRLELFSNIKAPSSSVLWVEEYEARQIAYL